MPRRRRRQPAPQAHESEVESPTSVLAVGGLFRIGALTTRTWIIALRTASGLSWDLRTTDGARVSEERSSCNGTLHLDARSRDGQRRLVLAATAPPAEFGPPIQVPTASGFSDAPGCSEAHGATVSVHAYARFDSRVGDQPAANETADLPQAANASARVRRAVEREAESREFEWRLIEHFSLGLAALEFGGVHTCAAQTARGETPRQRRRHRY
jgi:hypothetical protein